MEDGLREKVSAARAAIASSGEIINAVGDQPPRYELFHAANSICSQKVRCVLAHHRLPYLSHPINMFLGQTYLPEYVRLRMIGCEDHGGALVSRHSGSTSAAEGCDGVVVPTLIDRRTSQVIVDSKRICLHLDAQLPENERLRPESLTEAVDAELGIVDGLPNYQMLMGRKPGAGEALTKSFTGPAFSEQKVAWCDRYLEAHGDEPSLVRAYSAKRAKELSAATDLFSPEAMRAAYGRAESALDAFERRLKQSSGAWLFGDSVTMADLFWGIELLRMKNTGIAPYWEDGRLPEVERFAAAASALPSIRAGVIDWPGAIF